MSFRAGTFEREKTGAFRRFCPARSVHRLVDVSLEELWSEGKRLILLDVDHTIVKWREEDFAPGVTEWVAQARAMGFELCILSNTRHPERLQRLSERIGIPTKRGKFKPSPDMYQMALSEYKVEPEQAVMIGDQIMTDILGANRSGIDAIWLQKMDGPEFAGTKVNRLIEKFITSFLYKSLVINGAEEAPGSTSLPLFERPIVRQFAKFLFVGAISFVIDNGIRFLLLFFLKSGGSSLAETAGASLRSSYPALFGFAKTNSEAFYPVTAVIGSFVATFNSYIMNRAFTFKIKGSENAGKQLAKVFIVNYIGLAINVAVSSYFFTIIPGHPKRSAAVSGALGALVAAVWNFAGQRYFAFKVHKSE